MAITTFLKEIPRDIREWNTFLRTATLGIKNVTDEMLRDSLGWSVIGRASATPGEPADIQATATGQFLRVRGSQLGFDAIQADEIPEEIARKKTITSISADAELVIWSVNLVSAASVDVTVSFPASAVAGDEIYLKKVAGDYLVRIASPIDGYVNMAIEQINSVIKLCYTGSDWIILNHSYPYAVIGDGAMTAQSATITGTGTSGSTGTGALAAQSASISGAGTVA